MKMQWSVGNLGVGEGGWQSEGCLAKRQALFGTGRATLGHKSLIPGKKEMGRGLIRKKLGLGPWVPCLRGATGSVASFIQPLPYFRWNVTQNWTPPRLLSSRSVTVLHAQPDSWPPVQSHRSSLHPAARLPGSYMGASGWVE